MKPEAQRLTNILEAALLAAEEPLSLRRLERLFADHEGVGRDDIRAGLERLETQLEGRGIRLRRVASGYRLQAEEALAPWLQRLWEERPPRYSRALLETLALIAYRQPITRAEIEEIRGVSVSSQIMRTLQERGWVHQVGHREVPGRPALFATTRAFLDYFDMQSLESLPALDPVAEDEDGAGTAAEEESDERPAAP